MRRPPTRRPTKSESCQLRRHIIQSGGSATHILRIGHRVPEVLRAHRIEPIVESKGLRG